MTPDTCPVCGNHVTVEVSPDGALDYRPRTDADLIAVVTEPGMLFGSPHLAGHRLDAEMIAGLYLAYGYDEVVHSYDLTRGQVLVCCWWAAVYGPRKYRKRWKDWAEANFDAMWRSDWAACPLPPTKEP